MKIGITGFNGFLGKHLVQFIKYKYEYELFNKNKYNLFNIESMRQFVEDKDIIFHLAGSNRGSDDELIRINTIGTMNLLEAIKRYSKKDTKIIYTSSLQVYGFTYELIRLNEKSPYKPDSVYGISKKTAEDLIDYYNKRFDLKFIIFRISNIYGPGCRPYYNSVISTFIDFIKKNKRITINGDGEQSRDFIYVSDVINAFSKILKQDYDSDIFNICTGKPTTINEIINTLKILTNFTNDIQYNENDAKTNYLIGDPSKANEIMGYKSKVSLKDGLTKTIQAYGDLL